MDLDDILITDHTRQDHMSIFKVVLEMLEQSGLTLKHSKCAFFNQR